MEDLRASLTKLNGRGVDYFTIIRKSPLLSMLFYDTKSLYLGESKDLKPKTLQRTSIIQQNDGKTIRWQDIDLRPTNTELDAAANSGDLVLTVKSATGIAVGDSVYSPTTGETFIVTAIAGADLTIEPAVGIAGIADNAAIKVVSYAIAKGGDGKTFSISASDEQTNYIQDTSVLLPFDMQTLNSTYQVYMAQGVTPEAAIAAMVKQYVGNGISKLFQTIANAFYVGRKAVTTISAKSVYSTGGFRTFYTGNANCAGATALAAWDALLTALSPLQKLQVSEDPSGQVVLVLSTSAAQKLSNLVLSGGLDIVRSDMTLRSIGTNITQIQTVQGTINIITDPTIEDLDGTTANVGYAFIPGLVQMRSNPLAMTALDVTKTDVTAGNYEGIVLFAKPQNQVNDFEMEIFTNFGFIFGANTVNAGTRLYNVGVVTG